jgi:hypothetical protein
MLQLTDSTYNVSGVGDTGRSGTPDTVWSDRGTYVVTDSILILTSGIRRGVDTATASLHRCNDTLDGMITAPKPLPTTAARRAVAVGMTHPKRATQLGVPLFAGVSYVWVRTE